jgi:AcrR family transcriptional regulator
MNPPAATDSTRERIVAAATAEFSRYGIAGARIERIAKAAKTSKERVYAHFSGKEALYEYVSGRELAAVAEATRMDAADLPGYAGRLHDYFMAHPERYRLMTWGQLELPDGTPANDQTTRVITERKMGQLRKAQADGILDPSWDPLDILMLISQFAVSWSAHSDLIPTGDEAERAKFLAERRAAVVEAVERIFPAAK